MATEKKERDPRRVKLVNVRLSYPALWKPKGFGKKNEGEKAYQASFIIDPESRQGKILDENILDAIDAAKAEKWGKNPPKLKSDKLCYREGDPDKEEEDGMMILSSRNTKKIKVFDIDKLEVEEGDDGAPYAGCYVDAIVQIWAQDNDFGKRVNCSLEAVRFRDDGDPFGAPPVDPDEFDDIDDDDRSSRSSRGRGRDKDDDDDDDRGSRRSSRGRGRDKDDDDDDNDKGSRRGRGGRDKDDDEDEGRSRRRGRDKDEDDDDRSSSRRTRRSRDDDDDDRPSGRSRRSRDDDDGDDDDRSSSRRRSRGKDDDDEGDRGSRSRRRRRDDDDVV